MRILLILIFLVACADTPPIRHEFDLGGPENSITTFEDEGTPEDDGLLDWIWDWFHGTN